MLFNKSPKIVLVYPYIGGVPGLGLGYLAAYLRERMPVDVKILQRKFFPSLAEAILKEEPDMVGYFALTTGLNQVFELIEKVAENRPGTIQIMGGPHITAMPQSLPLKAAAGVIDEGEETFLQLVEIFKAFGKLPSSELAKVLGIVFYDNGRLVKTGNRPAVMDLDSLPKPARDLLNIKGYFSRLVIRAFPTKIYRSASVMTSRGCPFRCVFCQSGMYGPKFRFHSAGRVIEEIEELIEKYNCDHVQILDDQFLCNKPRLREIVRGIKSRGLDKKAAFFCYIRAVQLDEEVAGLLKEMNTNLVFIGFESNSDKILKYLKDNTCSAAANQRAYDLCRKYKMHVYGAFIFGSPEETMADMEETYRFMKKNPMALCEVSRLTPLPGSGIWDYALKKGVVSSNMNLEDLKVRVRDDTLEQVWLAEKVTKEDFLKFFNEKLRPLTWRYLQTANNFKITDLFQPGLIKLFLKNPKFYVSVFKRSLESVFYQFPPKADPPRAEKIKN